MNQFTSIWAAKPELDDALKAMWKDHSASQCAAKLHRDFGVIVTRSAVIGRLSRIGYSTEQKVKLSDRTVAAKRTSVPFKPRPTAAPLLPAVCEALPSRELTFEQLGTDECCFIAGDPIADGPNIYCGHPTFKFGLCAPHYRLCWRLPEERKK